PTSERIRSGSCTSASACSDGGPRRGRRSASALFTRLRQLEFLDAIVNLIAVESEQLRRARLVPPRALEGLQDHTLLDVLEVEAGRRQLDHVRLRDVRERDAEATRLERVTGREQHRALYCVAQFANVPRPAVAAEHPKRRRRR